jgi:hypothetical protein
MKQFNEWRRRKKSLEHGIRKLFNSVWSGLVDDWLNEWCACEAAAAAD